MSFGSLAWALPQKSDQLRVCKRIGPQPTEKTWSTLLPLVVDELVHGGSLPQAGHHGGDVVQDDPDDLKYVVHSDCEIPYWPR